MGNYTKREREFIAWFSKQSNRWWDAYFEYEGRRTQDWYKAMIKAKSWFNSTLKGLKAKGELKYVPFVSGKFPEEFYWFHPGFENSGEVQAVIMVEPKQKIL